MVKAIWTRINEVFKLEQHELIYLREMYVRANGKAFWKWACREGATRWEVVITVCCWFYEKELVEELDQGNGKSRERGLASGAWGMAQNCRAKK